MYRMEFINDYSDTRLKLQCIHCGSSLAGEGTNQDHVPSKSLLHEPYPPEPPTIEICASCNASFSRDEEYFAAFLGAALTGSTEPDVQTIPAAQRIFRRNPSLKARIDRSRRDFKTIRGESRTIWEPEVDRVKNVLVKNARGHIFYELGEPAVGDPLHFAVCPLETLSEPELAAFFQNSGLALWPEVGSRMMARLVTGKDLEDGWVFVQNGVYRFSVSNSDVFAVKIIIREYLAAEIIFST